MWFNLIKVKKTSLLSLIEFKDLKKKTKLFDSKKIINTVNLFLNLLKSFIHIFDRIKMLNLVLFYSNIKNIISKSSLKNYNAVLQMKSTKKQLVCTVFKKKKIIFFISNGFFLKKLSLKKSQKKDSKVSVLNLKNIVEFIKKKNINSLVVNLVYAKSFSIRHLYFLKNNLKKMNILYLYSPKINFSKNRFKKVKSIKRKLKKKYVYSV